MGNCTGCCLVATGVTCDDSFSIVVLSGADPRKLVVGLGVDGSEPFSRPYRGEAPADRFEGTVLLRCMALFRPEGLFSIGDAAPCPCPLTEVLVEFLDDTERFLLMLPNLRTLSAPALDVELDLPNVLLLLGVAGDPGDGEGAPLWTSLTVFSSAAVPAIPTRKESWFSMRKIRTSWLRRYS